MTNKNTLENEKKTDQHAKKHLVDALNKERIKSCFYQKKKQRSLFLFLLLDQLALYFLGEPFLEDMCNQVESEI